jgi:hypothetical protein
LDSGDYFYKPVLEVSFTLYIAELGLINWHFNCGQDKKKNSDGAYVCYIHVYWLFMRVLHVYTCILMVYMGGIYMYIECVYGCYIRGRLITPTVITPTVITPTIISPTIITPTVITPTLINTPTMHPGLYHHILYNRNSSCSKGLIWVVLLCFGFV